MDGFGTGYVAVPAAPAAHRRGRVGQVLRPGHAGPFGESFIARSIIELAHNLVLRMVAEASRTR